MRDPIEDGDTEGAVVLFWSNNYCLISSINSAVLQAAHNVQLINVVKKM